MKDDGDMNVHTRWYKKFLWLYQAPVSVFYWNMTFYLLYLALFAYVLTANFCLRPSIAEYVIISWVFTFVLEEVRQILHEPGGVREKFVTWISYLANMFDSTAFSLFIIGPAFNSLLIMVKSDRGHPRYNQKQNFMRKLLKGLAVRLINVRDQPENTCPLSLDEPEYEYVKIGHIFYCLSFFVSTLRVLTFFNLSRRLGPKIRMIVQELIQKFLKWLQ